jgi:hypothetical protein
MAFSQGQGSGDFSGQLKANPFYTGTRNSMGQLAPDGFFQSNPPVVLTNVSSTLVSPPRGVLAGTVAFTRPDAGNGFHGGAKAGTGVDAKIRPLGLYINDAQGNPYENTPAVGSGRCPYYSAQGTYGIGYWETFNLVTGAALTYSAGDSVYASRNGLLTNVDDADNSYEKAAGLSTSTLIGIVTVAPDANNTQMVIDLRV